MRNALLDAAEELFARLGYDGVSMRDLTRQARTNLASVNYHFGSKERLFEAVILRRVRPINQQRIAELNQTLNAPGQSKPELAAVLKAFARALIVGMRSDERESLRQIMVRLFMESDPLVKPIFEREFLPVVRQFRNALALACPHMSQQQLDQGLVFYAGAMINFLTTEKRSSLKLLCDLPSTSDEEALEWLVSFGVAGFSGLAIASKPPSKTPPARE